MMNKRTYEAEQLVNAIIATYESLRYRVNHSSAVEIMRRREIGGIPPLDESWRGRKTNHRANHSQKPFTAQTACMNILTDEEKKSI